MRDVFPATVNYCDHEAVGILAHRVQLLLHVELKINLVIQARLGPVLLESMARVVKEQATLLAQFFSFGQPDLSLKHCFLEFRSVGVYEIDNFAVSIFRPKLLHEALDAGHI